MRGWYNLACFNGLSQEQQVRLVTWGNLPLGYQSHGECKNGAEIEITTVWDEYPGPRFYCRDCAIGYLQELPASKLADSIDHPSHTGGNLANTHPISRGSHRVQAEPGGCVTT